jgi:hypothetical protein
MDCFESLTCYFFSGCRMLTPRLKRRGIVIETEIEYRVGPYFVLAVNVKSVNWRKLVKRANRDVAERKARWKKDNESENSEKDSKQPGFVMSYLMYFYRLSRLTRYEVMAKFLACCHYFHWIIYTPICWILYYFGLGTTFRTYFLSSVADGRFKSVGTSRSLF